MITREESKNVRLSPAGGTDAPALPAVVDRVTFQAELDALRIREKAHMREGDAIEAAHRRLPMVEVDGATPLIGEPGPVILLDTFEGHRMLITYYFMWHAGHPAPEHARAAPGLHRRSAFVDIFSVVFLETTDGACNLSLLTWPVACKRCFNPGPQRCADR
jgi:predicted dithiol-disulfide oxidoreductase (DUF899 family)